MSAARPTKIELFKQALHGNDMPLEGKKVILQFLAKGITDHESFRKVLTKVEPALRKDAYDTMRPLVKFRPKPLDTYIMESAQQAEREQLPILDPSAPGGYRPFTPARNAVDMSLEERDRTMYGKLERADTAISPEWGKMLCRKCTKEQNFPGATLVECRIAAIKAGWVYEGETWVCPKCPAVRPN